MKVPHDRDSKGNVEYMCAHEVLKETLWLKHTGHKLFEPRAAGREVVGRALIYLTTYSWVTYLGDGLLGGS